ncbi:MAG: transcriptional regulator GcvA [Alphaproteobacteria bacterium]|nr:transcriptional regulator GcvA [Alphaproteobacteria bacterium]
MATRLPPLNALRAFEASARNRSFSRAADELAVTPAAISHQIKGLEEYLGAKLFRRAKRTLMLTEAGQTLLPGIRKGFAAFYAAMAEFGHHDESGFLTVAVTPSFAAKWLVHRIEHFNIAYPEVDIRISTGMGLADYAREGIEIGVRFGRGDYEGLVTEHLLSNEMQPVCSPRLLGGGRRLERPEDLANFTLLHDDGQRGQEAVPDWAMWLRAAGVAGVDAARGLRFDTAGAAQNAALEGVGVALGRTTLVTDDIDAGRLIYPFDLVLPSEFGYWIVYTENSIKRPKVKAFRDWLKAEAWAYEEAHNGAAAAEVAELAE